MSSLPICLLPTARCTMLKVFYLQEVVGSVPPYTYRWLLAQCPCITVGCWLGLGSIPDRWLCVLVSILLSFIIQRSVPCTDRWFYDSMPFSHTVAHWLQCHNLTDGLWFHDPKTILLSTARYVLISHSILVAGFSALNLLYTDQYTLFRKGRWFPNPDVLF